MSTRCQIGFYTDKAKLSDWDALIYRHSDGYPDTKCGVIAEFLPILEQFDKGRGLDDLEYAAAWVMYRFKEIQQRQNKELPSKGFDFLSYGICHYLHGDIAYYYAVYPDKIQIYKPLNEFWDNSDFSNLRRLKTIKFKWQTITKNNKQ